MEQLPTALVDALDRVRDGRGIVLVLTGAGISAESGIPTFRGKDGYWTIGSRHYHPQELATLEAFERLPRDVWHWYLFRRGMCQAAQPNLAHTSLVRLEQALPDRVWIVTQNVDGLHLRAGNSHERTLQIHGNIDFMRCTRRCTDTLHPIPDEIGPAERDQPLTDDAYSLLRCPDCGALTRPHVLWFDEFYEEALHASSTAVGLADRADVCIVVGTSGSTNLPLRITSVVASRGRLIVDVNATDGRFSRLAEQTGGHALQGRAGDWVPRLVDVLAPVS